MSDSDDTDTLIFIPPNLFTVPSETDEGQETSVVEELINHVEGLETRVNFIEKRASLLGDTFPDSSCRMSDPTDYEDRRTKNDDSSSDRSIQTAFRYSLGVNDRNKGTGNDRVNQLNRVDQYLESIEMANMDNSFESAADNVNKADVTDFDSSKHWTLPDLKKLLKEMEDTGNEIEKKLRVREHEYKLVDYSAPTSVANVGRPVAHSNFRSSRGEALDGSKKPDQSTANNYVSNRRAFLLGDNLGSVPNLGLGVRELYNSSSSPRKFDERKPIIEEPFTKRDAYLIGSSNNDEDIRKSSGSSSLLRSPNASPQRLPRGADTLRPKILSPRRKLPFTDSVQSRSSSVSVSLLPPTDNNSDKCGLRSGSGDSGEGLSTEPLRIDRGFPYQSKALPSQFRKNLLSLADLWESENKSSSEDDPIKLRQKLEEEKLRRIHLEEAITSLNKCVLEEQEKLAVAMAVDEGKDKAIVQITEAWKQMVKHWKNIEADRHAMSQRLITEKSILKKAREDVDKKVERWEKEVSQALDLAAGFKSKCEFVEAEFEVSKEVMDGKKKELETQLASKEGTLSILEGEKKQLTEKLEKALTEIQEIKQRESSALKEVEILSVKLNRVEAELTVTKEQKELAEMRLMEEKGRVTVLEQQRSSLEYQLEESKTIQNKTEQEAKAAVAQLDTSKAELRNLYQNQLEMVVRTKLTEFQGQLDAAQLAMQAEIDSTKEMAQKRAEEQHTTLVNSHVSEIRRLEAIHKEETRSLEMKLVESERRRMKLENNHKEIAQKLHGVMENQWQQALSMLTSELSTRQSHTDPHRIAKHDVRFDKFNPPGMSVKPSGDSESSDETAFNKDDLITCRSNPSKKLPSGKQEQLFKYIQMLLDKTPGKAGESSTSVLDSSMSVEAQSNHHAFLTQPPTKTRRIQPISHEGPVQLPQVSTDNTSMNCTPSKYFSIDISNLISDYEYESLLVSGGSDPYNVFNHQRKPPWK